MQLSFILKDPFFEHMKKVQINYQNQALKETGAHIRKSKNVRSKIVLTQCALGWPMLWRITTVYEHNEGL